jgi:hypothetical protein
MQPAAARLPARRAHCRSSWRSRRRGTAAVPRSVGLATVPLEEAISALATAAAFDLRTHGEAGAGAPETPMLWQYQALGLHVLPPAVARWPDGTAGRAYTPLLLEVGHERLGKPYVDEADMNRLPPPLRAALGEVPLLVRLLYMNQCHSLNGAAAMALVRHARARRVRWTIGGVPVRSIGWRWGNAPEGGASLTIAQVGTERVKQQAQAHQVATFTTDAGEEHVLDLSVAQFGLTHAVRSRPALVPHAAGCEVSPTLARRAASGEAPALFAPSRSPAASAVHHRRLERGQSAVEAALALVDARGFAVRGGYPLCGHVMPAPFFRPERPPDAPPGPDDDLVEGALLEHFRKFAAVLSMIAADSG